MYPLVLLGTHVSEFETRKRSANGMWPVVGVEERALQGIVSIADGETRALFVAVRCLLSPRNLLQSLSLVVNGLTNPPPPSSLEGCVPPERGFTFPIHKSAIHSVVVWYREIWKTSRVFFSRRVDVFFLCVCFVLFGGRGS